ncbi:hypothetical protein [Lactococcus lactis]
MLVLSPVSKSPLLISGSVATLFIVLPAVVASAFAAGIVAPEVFADTDSV